MFCQLIYIHMDYCTRSYIHCMDIPTLSFTFIDQSDPPRIELLLVINIDITVHH